MGLALPVLLLASLLLRAALTERFTRIETGDRWFGFIQVITNDAPIHLAIASLLYLSFLDRIPRYLRVLSRVFALGFLGLYLLDVAVMLHFHSRLTVNDVLKYAGYSLKYLSQIQPAYGALILPAGLLSLALFFYLLVGRFVAARRTLLFAGLVVPLSVATLQASDDNYVHSWRYKNLVEYNADVQSESRAYSTAFLRTFVPLDDGTRHFEGRAEYPNIVLLMVESLSSYQSEFFSGIKDWTPNLDRIARESMSFTSFYANGFVTEDGEIALLTGRLPIYPPSSFTGGGGTMFSGSYGKEGTLPDILGRRGYETEFLTSSDLSFSDTGAWAQSLGFDYVEGHEHPYYEDWDRYHFKAAPDEALYDRVFDRIGRSREGRVFVFVKTATTHHPFVDPNDGSRSEEGCFRYADRQLGAFYDRLHEAGFFEDGVLIVVGDHHSMVPLKEGESETLGRYRAAASVPLVLARGDGTRLAIDESYQQVDVFNGLSNLGARVKQASDWRGDVFALVPAKFLGYRRGDHRHLVSVFSEGMDYLIELDGDDTRLVEGGPADTSDRAIVNRINAIRTGRPMEVARATTKTDSQGRAPARRAR